MDKYGTLMSIPEILGTKKEMDRRPFGKPSNVRNTKQRSNLKI